MASIYLVRHGQAGFFKLNYDQLSDLGHHQSELVGKALAVRGVEAHKVIHGKMQRHKETMQGAQKHWHSYGTVIEDANFNEFDSDEIIAKAFPKFANKAALGAWLSTKSNKRVPSKTSLSKQLSVGSQGNSMPTMLNLGLHFINALSQV